MTDETPSVAPWTRRIFAPLCVFLIAVGILLLSDVGYIKAAEHWTSDWRTALFSYRKPSQDENVALVLVTEDTLADAPVRIPMDRHMIANVVRAISAAQPSALGIDFIFARPTNSEADSDLLAAIRNAKIPIVLGAMDDNAKLPEKLLRYHRQFLADAARPVGNVYFERKSDPFAISDQTIRNMAIEARSTTGPPSLAEVLADIKKPGVKPHNSTIAWLLPPKDGSQPFYEADAGDLLGDPADVAPVLAGLKNKIVLLGSDLVDLDRHLIPLSVSDDARVPGVLIHANVVSQLLDDRWIRKTGPGEDLALLLAISCLGYWLSRNFAIGRFTKSLALAGSAALVLAGFAAFKLGVIIPYTTGLAAWIASISLGRHIDDHYRKLAKFYALFSQKGRLSWRVLHRLGVMAFWR